MSAQRIETYVDLGRLFCEPREQRYEDIWGWGLRFHHHLGLMTWDTLLESSHAVILGEAGAGKSKEFVHRVACLRAEGQPAFFVPLEELRHGLVRALSVEAEGELSEWRRADTEGFFFLDALDEAKLDGYRLDRAMRDLHRDLGSAWDRARVILSCRPSEWSGSEDESSLRTSLPGQEPPAHDWRGGISQASRYLRIVALAPLFEPQVRRLAATVLRGSEDPDGFMSALAASGAEGFAARPLDVLALARIWKAKRRLGTLAEVVEVSIRDKLRPRRDTDSAKPEDVRRVVERIAAAFVLCGRNFLVDPVASARNPLEAGTVLDVHSLFPDVATEVVRDALQRAVFDPAVNGRVGFHHRSTREYLAAEWLRKLTPACRGSLDAVLFRDIYGLSVVPIRLEPVVAWLALAVDWVRDRTIEVAPHILLAHGDPSRLPETARARALRSFVARYPAIPRREADEAVLARFMTPALGPVVAELLCDRQQGTPLRTALINLCRHAGAGAPLDDLTALVRDPDEEEAVRNAAAFCVAGAEPDVHLAELCTWLAAGEEAPAQVAQHILCAGYPVHLDFARIAVLGASVQDHGRVALAVADRTQPAELGAALRHTVPGFADEGDSRVLSGWPAALAAALCIRRLETDAGEDVAACVRLYLELAGDGGAGSATVAAALRNSPGARQALLWGLTDRFAATHGRRPTSYEDLTSESNVPQLTQADLSWLVGEVLGHPDDQHRLIALDAIVVIAPRNLPPEITDLSGTTAVGRRFRRWQRRRDERGRQDQRRALQDQAQHARRQRTTDTMRAAFEPHVNDFQAGLHPIPTYQAVELWRMHGVREDPDRWRWLSAELGTELASAMRCGLQVWWRSWRADYPHERGDLRTVDGRDGLARHGLQLWREDGHTLATVDQRTAEVAVRLAVGANNRVPSWLDELLEGHGDLMTAALTAVVRSELDGHPAYDTSFLSRLRSSEATRARAVAARVCEAALRAGPPPEAAHTLQLVLELIDAPAACTLAHAEIPRRLAEADGEDRQVLWRAWFDGDAMGAVVSLSVSLERAVDPVALLGQVADALGVPMVASPVGGASSAFTNVEAIVCLLPLMHRYVPPSEDPRRAGTYVPTPRDHAASLRTHLVMSLGKLPGPAAVDGIRALMRNPAVVEHHHWMRVLLAQRAAEDALAMWDEGAVVAFERTATAPILTAADLLDVVVADIEDMRSHMERGPFSRRDAYQIALAGPGRTEHHVQKLVAEDLRLRTRQRYTLERETEVDLAKKPDISVSHPLAGTLPIEIKVADSWSHTRLVEALEEQLVAKYMRARSTRHGVLLLVRSGRKRQGWKTAEGVKLDWQQLLDDLRARATTLPRSAPHDIEAVRVLGIDMTTPDAASPDKRLDPTS